MISQFLRLFIWIYVELISSSLAVETLPSTYSAEANVNLSALGSRQSSFIKFETCCKDAAE